MHGSEASMGLDAVLMLCTTLLVDETLQTRLVLQDPDMGCWDVYCIICGGPPCLPWRPKLLAAIWKQQSQLKWLDRHEGIPLDNAPRHLSSYFEESRFVYAEQQTATFDQDDYCFTAYKPSWSHSDLPAPEWEGHGVTCHQKCYRLLVAQLDYKLQIQDVWPLAAELCQRSAMVDMDYGGITKYHCQVCVLPKNVPASSGAWLHFSLH